jgi:hypothetical protein
MAKGVPGQGTASLTTVKPGVQLGGGALGAHGGGILRN